MAEIWMEIAMEAFNGKKGIDKMEYHDQSQALSY